MPPSQPGGSCTSLATCQVVLLVQVPRPVMHAASCMPWEQMITCLHSVDAQIVDLLLCQLQALHLCAELLQVWCCCPTCTCTSMCGTGRTHLPQDRAASEGQAGSDNDLCAAACPRYLVAAIHAGSSIQVHVNALIHEERVQCCTLIPASGSYLFLATGGGTTNHKSASPK